MKQILIILVSCWLISCTNTRTVYRIDTVNEQAYYTRSLPKPAENGNYHIIDLDNNRVTILKNNVINVTPYTYPIRL